MFDLILKCGHLFDGTGAEPLVADIAVTGSPRSAKPTLNQTPKLSTSPTLFSSGLEYWPGILASHEHLVPLCEVAARLRRLYATHARNRDTQYDLGFAGAIATARQSGARLQISHIQQDPTSRTLPRDFDTAQKRQLTDCS